MKLYDTWPRIGGVELGTFEGGMDALGREEITKNFKKAKKMAIERLKEDISDIQNEIDIIESMNEEDVPRINNPYW